LIKKVGTHVSLGGARVALRLATAASPTPSRKCYDCISLRIVTSGRDVVGEFLEIASLISFSTSHPSLLLFRREFSIHGGCVFCSIKNQSNERIHVSLITSIPSELTGKLTKRHPRVLGFEGFSHGVLVEQVCAHVTLGSVWIARWFLGHLDGFCGYQHETGKVSEADNGLHSTDGGGKRGTSRR
jgi:hypothetical protein